MASTNGHRKIRYAVVGAGNIAQVAVLPAFEHAENSELVVLISGDPEKRIDVARRFKIPRTGSYEDYDGILQSGDVDAVYIALPNSMHRDFAERAARAGVHILCEKPMAMTEEDCEAMIRAADEAAVKLMIAYRLHFEEANLRALDIVRTGLLGEPRIMSSVFTHQVREGDIRMREDVGGGALFDVGIYCINAARTLFQAEPEEVVAFEVRDRDPRSQGVDDVSAALLRFPGDRIAQILCGQVVASVSSYRIAGTRGDLRVEPAFGYTDKLVHHLTVDGKTKEETFKPRDQFAPELVHFSRCILEGTEPEPSGEEGLADVRVLCAITRSAQTGQPVRLPPFLRSRRPDMSLEMRAPPVSKQEPVNAPSPTESEPEEPVSLGDEPVSLGDEGGAGAYRGAPVISRAPEDRSSGAPRPRV